MTGNCSASQRVLANSLRVVSAKRGNPPKAPGFRVVHSISTLLYIHYHASQQENCFE